MKHIVNPRLGLWLGAMILFAGSLGLSSPTAGQVKQPGEKAGVSPANLAQMTVKGPNEAVVGRRFTLEIIITNPGAAPIKDLQFLAVMDENMEHESKAKEHAVMVDTIAAENLQIVRMAITPKKRGPGGVDITLRDKNGAVQQIRHVLPVFPEDDVPAQAPRPAGASPLQVTITAPKDCYADRSGIFLVHVVNTDSRPSADKLPLTVSYGTISQNVAMLRGFGNGRGGIEVPEFDGPAIAPPVTGGGGKFRGGFVAVANPTNPVRTAQLTLPALGPNESRTLPVVLTPRRIGTFQIDLIAGNQRVGSASVQVKFDPNVDLNSLLPVHTKTKFTPRLPMSLSEVPEVSIEDRLAKSMNANESFEHVAHMIDKINYFNAKKTDSFVVAMLEKRPEIVGLPWTMGAACRLQAERSVQFITELNQLRAAMRNPNNLATSLPNPAANPAFEKSTPARIAAMMQVLGPESTQLRHGMVKYLGNVSHVESTRALASLAIYSEEDQVRSAAVEVLKTRRDKDYSAILVQGLSYPWPAVAERAADAIVKLKRSDLLPQLVSVLETPDPRAPQTLAVEGKQVHVVREVVRINHLRNCMLCHAPKSAGDNAGMMAGMGGFQPGGGQVAASPVLLAQVPIPNQPLPVSPGSGGGYGQFTVPDTLVRFDITYLRQDFSVMLPVSDAQPWPQTQRFDFLVRTSHITEAEAQAYRDLLKPAGAGELSPYQRAAVAALRQLTGRDAEPTGPAWRKVLGQL